MSSHSADWQPTFASEDSGAEIRIYASENDEFVSQKLETPGVANRRNVRIGKSPELTKSKNIAISMDCLEDENGEKIGCSCSCDCKEQPCDCERKECCPPKKKKCAQKDDSALCLCVLLTIVFIIILAVIAHWGTGYSGYYHHSPHPHPHHAPLHYTY